MLTFFRTIHPLFSLFAHYDYKMSRMNRLLLVLGQMGLITILVVLAFTEPINEWNPVDSDNRAWYFAAVLCILTIPLPRCLFRFLERELYVFKGKDRLQSLSAYEYDKEGDKTMTKKPESTPAGPTADEGHVKTPSNANFMDNLHKLKTLDADYIKNQKTTQNIAFDPQEGDSANLDTEIDYEDRGTLIDSSQKCKCCFSVLIYLFWLASLVFTVVCLLFMNDLDSIEIEEKVSFVSYQLALVPWEDFVQLDEKYAF